MRRGAAGWPLSASILGHNGNCGTGSQCDNTAHKRSARKSSDHPVTSSARSTPDESTATHLLAP